MLGFSPIAGLPLGGLSSSAQAPIDLAGDGIAQPVGAGSLSTSVHLAGSGRASPAGSGALTTASAFSGAGAARPAGGGTLTTAIAATDNAGAPGGDPHWSSTSLLLHFAGVENGGVFTDSSPTTKTVTRSNTGVTTTTSKSVYGGSSAKFIFGHYLNVDDHPDVRVMAGDFTMEGWFWFNSIGSSTKVFSRREWAGVFGVTGGFSLQFYSGGWGFSYSNGSTSTSLSLTGPGGAPTINTWHHVAVSRTGTTLSLFVDGVLLGTAVLPLTAIDTPAAIPFSIGGPAENNTPLDGYADDVRITKGVGRYTSAFTPPAAAFPDYGDAAATGAQPYGLGTLTIATGFSGAGLATPLGSGELSTSILLAGAGVAKPSGSGSLPVVMAGAGAAKPAGSGALTTAIQLAGAGVARPYASGALVVGSVSMAGVGLAKPVGSGSLLTAITLSGEGLARPGGYGTITAVAAALAGGGVARAAGLGDLTTVINLTDAIASTPGDAHWSSVVLLLHGDGAPGSTAITDSSASSHVGGVVGANTFLSATKSKFGGSSIRFNGASWVNYGEDADFQVMSGDFTFECWLNLDSFGGSTKIFSKRDWVHFQDGGYSLHATGTQWTFQYCQAAHVIQSAIWSGDFSFMLNNWVHVALVKHGNSVGLYLNGVLRNGAFTPLPGGPFLEDVVTPFSVGGPLENNTPMLGYMDEVRLTKGVARYVDTAITTPPSPFPESQSAVEGYGPAAKPYGLGDLLTFLALEGHGLALPEGHGDLIAITTFIGAGQACPYGLGSLSIGLAFAPRVRVCHIGPEDRVATIRPENRIASIASDDRWLRIEPPTTETP